MEQILEGLGGIHLHCATCYSFTRCSQEDDACDNIPCRFSCSQVYHACKEKEHLRDLCPNARVPCLNLEYGCRVEILRRDMAAHLPVCPASLIVCTAEWHRWPLYSSHRIRKGKLFNVNPVPKNGQLDYELAMRDQQIINEALKNKFSESYSSKPSKYICRKKNLDDDTDPQTLKQLEQWEEEFKRRIKDIPIPMKYWEFPEFEKGNIHSKHCSRCVLKDCPGDNDNFCPIISCSWGCDFKFHACKSSEHSLICSFYVEPNDSDWIYRGMSLRNFRNSGSTNIKSKNKSASIILLPVQNSDVNLSNVKSANGSRIPDPPPPPSTPDFWNPCRFDIRYDFVNNKRERQKGMYALRCHEELRRDQYLWHYKNVHSEIVSELSCWIESRCPLYGYGCNFAVRRLYPDGENKTLTFNRFTGTFALSDIHFESVDFDSLLGLHSLPAEILSLIFSFLDPSSLHNLSVTCKYLREVCQSFLNIHGCVSPHWKRQRTGNGVSWTISYFRWFYSNAFQPIRKWKIEHLGEVSNHLMKCPYYQKMKHVSYEHLSQKSKEEWDAVFMKIKERRNTLLD